MVPTDPVHLLDPAPFGPLSYYGHIGIGCLGLAAALVALIAPKGRRVHVRAGYLFLFSIALVAVTALVLLATRMAPPLLVAAVTAVYAGATAYLALKPGTVAVKRTEYALFGVALLMLLAFAALASRTVAAGAINPVGPLVIAVIPVLLLAGDIHFFSKPDQRMRLRLRRHLARMIWAVVVAVRAPITEIYHLFALPVGLILFGPLIVGPAVILIFTRRNRGLR